MADEIKRQALRITLLDDCVFSVRNATMGGHRGLDRIPGQTLLGAAAARLYATFGERGDGSDAYRAFHSGRLRFLDGLPSDGKAIAYPVPLAWHRPKTGVEGDPIVHNFAHPKSNGRLPGDGQPKQLREGYVFTDGRRVEPARSLRLKTAIDEKTGRAKESYLFGYESLARGQTFIAWIEGDAACATLLDEVVGALEGEVLLGRSRSAEYGLVRIERVAAAPVAHGTNDSDRLTLWLLSDLALADEYGRPTAMPEPWHFGFTGGETIDWGHSFLRSRRYSPWNAYRHSYDRERLLLVAGGVISLKLQGTPSNDQLAVLEQGVGVYREAGLGRLWINPPLLAAETTEIRKHEVPAARDVGPRDAPLIAWLREQTDDWQTGMDEIAKKIAREFRGQVRAARLLKGVPEGEDFGPSRSQWGRVMEAARTKSGESLFTALFEEDSAVIKRGDVEQRGGEGWGEVIRYREGRELRLADWLRDRLGREGWKNPIVDTKNPEKPIPVARWIEEHPQIEPLEAERFAYLVRRLAHRLRQDTERRGV